MEVFLVGPRSIEHCNEYNFARCSFPDSQVLHNFLSLCAQIIGLVLCCQKPSGYSTGILQVRFTGTVSIESSRTLI